MTAAVDSKWAKVALGILAEFRNGINYNKDNFGKGIKVINVKDFQDYSIASFEGLDEVNPSGVIKEKDLLKNADIIFVRSNGNRELIGRSLFIQGIHEPITHSAFTIKLRFTSNRVLPRFYAYLFRTSLMRQTLSAYGNGTNISNLNQGILTHLQVPLPPLLTQHKIVGILSAYDRLIENNTRRIKILEEMARSLYDEWFVKFRFPGYEQTQMVDSDLGLIPEGWEVGKLGSVCHVLSGYAFKSRDWQKTGIPVIKIKNINSDNTVNLKETDYVSPEILSEKFNKYLLKNGDFLVAMTGATAGKVGKLRINNPVLLNQRVAKLEPLDHYRAYIWQIISSKEGQMRFFNLADGAAQPNMSASQIEKLQIILPSSFLCQHFQAVANDIHMQIDNFIFRNQNLQQTRDLLLPKLISGEIDVENLDIETGIMNESEEVSSSSQEAIAG